MEFGPIVHAKRRGKASVISEGGIYLVDVIEIDGVLWLVPEWLGELDQKWQTPKWRIRLTGLAFQQAPDHPDYGISVSAPISKAALSGDREQARAAGLILERTDVRIRLPLQIG